MKRTIATLMLLAAAMVARAFSFSAVASSGQTLYYSVTGNGTVSVVSPDWDMYAAPTGGLVIPATVDNDGVSYSVTAIGIEAFRGCTGLTSVAIPEGVTSIMRMAFYGCSALDTITLPSTLTEIRVQAFRGTAYVNNAANRGAGGMLYIGQWLYSGFTNAVHPAEAAVADGTVGIAGMALYFDTALRKLTLPASLLYISDQAMSDCIGLDSIFSLASVPPQASENAFDRVSDLTVVVPCGSGDAYLADPVWSMFNIVEDTCSNPQNPVAEADMTDGLVLYMTADGLTIGGAEGHRLTVCDVMGRRLASLMAGKEEHIALPATGVYLVAVDGLYPQKVCYCK